MFKIGDKVTPVKKSTGLKFENCKEWNIGKEQGFLYVVGFWENGYALSAFKNGDRASLYCYDDVVEFIDDNSKEWLFIRDGIYINNLEIDAEWERSERFLESMDENEGILCFSSMENSYVDSFTLEQVKRIHKYLGKVIDYCEANRD